MADTHVRVTIIVEGRDHRGSQVQQSIIVRSDLLEIADPERQLAAQRITIQRVDELFGQLYKAACPPSSTDER